jgi:hypothetical protein
MDIFSLKRDTGPAADEATAFVVVAETAHEARKLAAQSAGSEGAYPWAFEAELVKVGTAESDVAAGVLLGSYVNGYDG